MRDKRRPWIKWYPGDWRKDIELRMCSYAARGLWADVLALMAESERFGYLLVKGRPPTPKQLAGLLGGSEREIKSLLDELGEGGVYSRIGDAPPEDLAGVVADDLPAGTLYSRRMLRDNQREEVDRENGNRPGAGNPAIRRGTVAKADRNRPYRRSDAPAKTRRIFDRDGGRCWWCAREISFDTFHVDHVVAICDGGSNDESNLVAACADCNGRRAIEPAPATVRHQYAAENIDTDSNPTIGVGRGRIGVGIGVGIGSDIKAQKPEARSQKPESSSANDHLGAARAPPMAESEPAVRVIEAFDRARITVFGEENERPWPRPKDLADAKAMLAAGATVEQCEAVFTGVFQRLKAGGDRPAETLAYMRKAVADALRERMLDIPPFLDRTRGNGAGRDAGWEPPPRDPAYVVIARAWDRGNARANGIAMPRLEDYPGPGSDAWEAACERWQRAGCPAPMPRLEPGGAAKPSEGATGHG